MKLPKAECKRGVYTISDEKQANELFKSDLVSRRYSVPTNWITHLRRDYSNAPGVLRLGYTVIESVVLVRLRENERPEGEILIKCKEGYISNEEAIGLAWLPTPDEIAEHAKTIRDANEAAGIIRKAETVGFDLQRVVERPMVLHR